MSDFLQLAAPGVRGLHPYQPGKPIEELEREYEARCLRAAAQAWALTLRIVTMLTRLRVVAASGQLA